MIKEALVFLKEKLNAHVQELQDSNSPATVTVVFVDTSAKDPIVFHDNAVTVLVVGIEEEKTLRSADPYRRYSSEDEEGKFWRVQPEIRLNLHVLFVANFMKYEDGLHYLSVVIQYFLTHRVFDHADDSAVDVQAPALHENIERLIMELHTLPLSEQNDLWNALRTTYHPSVLYKVKMVVFSDEEPAEKLPVMKDKQLKVERLP